MIKKAQQGFTLIELMIVVAIIGILAAVAIPAYQDYVLKAKLSRINSAISPLKLALAEYYQENGSYPASNDQWTSLGLSGTPAATNEIASTSVTATTGAIVLTLAASGIKTGIDGGTITKTPTPTATSIQWQVTCSSITDTVGSKAIGCGTTEK